MKRLILLLVFPAAALAQPTPRPAPDPATPQVTEFTFEGDEVRGEFQRPGGEVVEGETRETFRSLVQVRANFEPELLRSAEDL